MKRCISALLLLFTVFSACAQSVERDIYSGSGSGFAVSGSLQLQSNVGELASVTMSGGSVILTQGFIQPEPALITFSSQQSSDPVFSAYPNPVINVLTLSIEAAADEDIGISVFDETGRLIITRQVTVRKNVKSDALLDLGQLDAGVYLVRLLSGSLNQSVRITKL
jgi:hypothetical protein